MTNIKQTIRKTVLTGLTGMLIGGSIFTGCKESPYKWYRSVSQEYGNTVERIYIDFNKDGTTDEVLTKKYTLKDVATEHLIRPGNESYSPFFSSRDSIYPAKVIERKMTSEEVQRYDKELNVISQRVERGLK